MSIDNTVAKPKRVTLRDQQKAMTRERLLDAAFEVFTEVGFRSATIDQIANAAGAYRATFYLHFKDKSEVAAGLARRLTPMSVALFTKLCAMKSPSLGAIEKWLSTYLEEIRTAGLLIRLTDEALVADKAFMEEYKGFQKVLTDETMAEAFQRIPAKRRALVRSKFILLVMMLSSFVRLNAAPDSLYPGPNAYRALAEVWKSQFFDEQTEAD